MGKEEKAIAIKDLKKAYKDHRVLNGISFSIKKGSIFALLGSNGAGKTTTVKMLSTLLKPDAGSINILGIDLERQPEKVREKISLTGQFSAVDELLTGRENMKIVAKLRRFKDMDGTIEKLLKKLDLYQWADRRVAVYSGGMKRKLDLAMSILGNPEILFLDEPTTGLDPQSRCSLWEKIYLLKKNGMTIFLTTQYLEEAEKLGDHIVILHEGKIAADGTVDQLLNLLPRGFIELSFDRQDQMIAATEVLKNFQIRTNPEKMLITTATDGTVEQIERIFHELNKSGVSIQSFKQISPTLEDVFLSIIEENKIQEEH